VKALPVLLKDWQFFSTPPQRRFEMDVKLYVGNLSYDTTEQDLQTLFSASGTVKSVALIKDRDTGRSKGFAFVEMSSQAEAEEAIKTLDGKMVGDREIKVNKARPPEERSGFGNRPGRGGGDRDRNRRSSGGGTRRY